MIEGVDILEMAGASWREVTEVTQDSREVSSGCMFVAHKGSVSDGHDFIDSAVKAGAAVVVCEHMPDVIDPSVCYLRIADTGKSLGVIASQVYGHPSEKLELVGVTGTNGKTTVATLLYRLFTKMGYRCGLLSTVENIVVDNKYPTKNTTPDPVIIQRLLKQMVDEGCGYCFMEVSSHGIYQDRIAGLKFRGAIFTNITREHLDFHKTFEEYIRVKKCFFDGLPRTAFAVTNADDRNGLVMTQNTAATVRTYSLTRAADYRCRIVEEHLDGTMLEISGMETWVKLIGRFNAYNLTAIFASACELGAEPLEVLRVLSTLNPVAGRFDTLRAEDGRLAIVDYAHTPDAVENVLKTISELKCSAKVLTVVGCGGDRDRGKRPIMASIAAKYSDTLILTSDNPRSEEPSSILDEMFSGLTVSERKDALVIEDRSQAIATAARLATAGDIILIAGKGHENYQEIKGIRHHFDDMEQIRSRFFPE